MAKRRKKKKVSKENKLKLKRFAVNSKSSQFLDRDISLLSFQSRVLTQASDNTVPLLDRFRFLAIFHSNLDDFFTKRMWISRHYQIHDPSSLKDSKLLAVRENVLKLYATAENTFTQLKKELATHDIHICNWSDLSTANIEKLKTLFFHKIFPVLTPLAVDVGHPFPHISSMSVSLAVALKYPGNDERVFSRVKIPDIFPPYYCIQDQNKSMWVRTEDIVQNFIQYLFPKMEIVETMLFRVTRNIEVESDEEENSSLLDKIEKELRERRYGEVVKLELRKPKSDWLVQFLKSELEIHDFDIYEMSEEIDFSHLHTICSIQKPELKYKVWTPVPVKDFSDDTDVFNVLKNKDILVHHPFESFNNSVENFIWTAANDKDVLAIKMTFYRTNEESSIVPALIKAAENGKQVVCLIELQARLDEERNIEWANRLERAGCHVVYGVVGLKTHCKVALVIRKEGDNIKCYSHIGSGNYNSNTAKLYTDVGLLTSRKEITDDVVELFHFLTGRSLKDSYRSILKAPLNLKQKFLKMILKETENARKGLPAEIIFKCNNLEDKDIAMALYNAAEAGVVIHLIIRTICIVKPGETKATQNIQVYSIVDRFLEHSRIFYFREGKDNREEGAMYLGSADLMHRNLERRVEVLVPLIEPALIEQGLMILDSYLESDRQTWKLRADGSYIREKSKVKGTQTHLMNYYKVKNKKKY